MKASLPRALQWKELWSSQELIAKVRRKADDRSAVGNVCYKFSKKGRKVCETFIEQLTSSLACWGMVMDFTKYNTINDLDYRISYILNKSVANSSVLVCCSDMFQEAGQIRWNSVVAIVKSCTRCWRLGPTWLSSNLAGKDKQKLKHEPVMYHCSSEGKLHTGLHYQKCTKQSEIRN